VSDYVSVEPGLLRDAFALLLEDSKSLESGFILASCEIVELLIEQLVIIRGDGDALVRELEHRLEGLMTCTLCKGERVREFRGRLKSCPRCIGEGILATPEVLD
jgi:hypothetical protein